MELIGSLDCGSIIVEMALALTGLPHTVSDIPYLKDGPERTRLLGLNPLGQVPTLILGDGTVMTESAAVLLRLHDLAPAAALLPSVDEPDRAAVLNRLIWLVAAVYPTFTYGDEPGKWTLAGETLRNRTDAHREAMFLRWESDFGNGPFARGAQLSALDLYLAAMSNWRPGRAWFVANTPRLAAAAEMVERVPVLAPIIARHRTVSPEA